MTKCFLSFTLLFIFLFSCGQGNDSERDKDEIEVAVRKTKKEQSVKLTDLIRLTNNFQAPGVTKHELIKVDRQFALAFQVDINNFVDENNDFSYISFYLFNENKKVVTKKNYIYRTSYPIELINFFWDGQKFLIFFLLSNDNTYLALNSNLAVLCIDKNGNKIEPLKKIDFNAGIDFSNLNIINEKENYYLIYKKVVTSIMPTFFITKLDSECNLVGKTEKIVKVDSIITAKCFVRKGRKNYLLLFDESESDGNSNFENDLTILKAIVLNENFDPVSKPVKLKVEGSNITCFSSVYDGKNFGIFYNAEKKGIYFLSIDNQGQIVSEQKKIKSNEDENCFGLGFDGTHYCLVFKDSLIFYNKDGINVGSHLDYTDGKVLSSMFMPPELIYSNGKFAISWTEGVADLYFDIISMKNSI